MKVLGLDLGTNSIGWAVVERYDENFELKEKGVRIFQEGVKIEKGIEGSKAAERTRYRSARRIKFRRKLRKINTLKVLSDYGYCPKLSDQELNRWRYDKIYPENDEFRNWWSTKEQDQHHPYYYRNLAVTERLNTNDKNDRYKIGRAFYHIAQRRGFLSNRLEGTKESEGEVKKTIAEINEQKGDKTLGQFFYEKYLEGEKIRDTYTHREQHYLAEFNTICEFQKLPEEFCKKLKDAIFYQRPLRSQKGLVGKCVFEQNKPRCPVSRPEFEEYRMLCFINNIKIKSPEDDHLRPLNEDERIAIYPLFYRKSKDHFDFEEIAKQLAPKKQYSYFKSRDKKSEDWLFNYHMKTTVSACPVSARFRSLFGEDFMNFKISYKREKDGRDSEIDINDIWHVLFTFDSEDKLSDFARKRIKLNEEQIKEFHKMKMKKDYAALSLKAIRKILPFLREGLIYSHSVFLANMEEVIPEYVWSMEENRNIIRKEIYSIIQSHKEENQINEIINGMIKQLREEDATWSKEAKEIFEKDLLKKIQDFYGQKIYDDFPDDKRSRIEKNAIALFNAQMNKNMGKGEFVRIKRIDERVKDFLQDHFDVDEQKLSKLYHPSAVEVYKPPREGKDGTYYLGSPMISSIKNPMAMRCLHQLRKVINELISKDVIDSNTRINIEMSRELSNANERKAWRNWQDDREKLRKEYAEKIKEHYNEKGLDLEPSDEDILKYQLWEEQNHKCVYTGNEIAFHEFFGSDPKYDIEHTIPRSISFDNSQANKTLCEKRYNRSVKRNRIPNELPNHDEILLRIEHWKKKCDELEKQIQQAIRQARSAFDNKDVKDRAIQKKHRLVFEKNYWQGKYNRFTMKDVPEGFKNSQIVDTGIITRYARMYLKTIFDKVYTVKGSTVADFRRMWGIQPEYEKKERVNHIHHCIDAITIACMTKDNYERMARFYHDWEEYYRAETYQRPSIDKPWETFSEDMKEIDKEVLISHYTPDNLPKQSKKKLRSRGKIKYNKAGEPIYQKGDTVRGALHKETNYGAIKRSVRNKKGEIEEKLFYTFRKPLDSLTDSDIKNIVDERIRTIVENGKKEEEKLIKQLKTLQNAERDAETEEEKSHVLKQIEELKLKIASLYAIENKDGSFTPIKKVRCIAKTVTNPLHVKPHRDPSKHKHKRFSNFQNDGNYMMGIYEGMDGKGRTKRDFVLVNNLEAGLYFNGKLDYNPVPDVHPRSGYKLRSILKVGTMVILWEKSEKEVWNLNIEKKLKRFYKVIGLSIQRIKRPSGKIDEYATIVLKHSKEARPGVDLKTEDGAFKADEPYMAQRKLNQNQFDALVQGYDFDISPIGQIVKI